MCTVVYAFGVYDVPVLVHNRDEEYGREWSSPRRDGGVLAPRDDREGGTWVGVNDSGLLAGVANLPVAADGDSRSRGLLCLDVLGCRSVDAARRLVEREVDRRRYDGFNLVVGGSDGGFVASFDVSGLSVFEVEGAGVVTNSGFDDPDGKARRVAEALPDAASADDWLDGVRPLMSDHDLGVCVHGDDRGTTSSTLVRGGTDPAVWFASGPPCEADYVSCV